MASTDLELVHVRHARKGEQVPGPSYVKRAPTNIIFNVKRAPTRYYSSINVEYNISINVEYNDRRKKIIPNKVQAKYPRALYVAVTECESHEHYT